MFRLLVFSVGLMISPFVQTAQQYKLDIETLMNENLVTSDSAYHVIYEYYHSNVSKLNTKTKYDLAKNLAMLTVRKGALELTKTWYDRIDSLQKILPKQPYDKEFEFSKITYFQSKQMIDSAELVLTRMNTHVMDSKDTFWLLNYYTKTARLHLAKGDKANTLKYIYISDSLNTIYKSETFNATIYGLKGLMLWKEDKLEETIDCFLKVIKIYENLGKPKQTLPYYRNMITMAVLLGRKEDALTWDKKLKSIQKKYTTSIGFYDDEVNRIFFFIRLEEYNQAINLADSVIILGMNTGRNYTHAIYLKGIAYRGLDQYDKAAPLIEDAFNRSKAAGNNERCSFYAEALYQTYFWKEKFEPAIKWLNIYTEFRDSLFTEKKLTEISVYESKLEALEQQKKVEELQSKALIQKQKNSILWLVFGLLSVSAFSLLYVKMLKTKQELLHRQIEVTEHKMAREKLEQQLEFKEKEIASQILNMVDKNSVLQEIKNDLKTHKEEINKHYVGKIIRVIDRSLDDNNAWDRFLESFKNLHSSFLDSLCSFCPELTSGEIRLISLLKMNLSTKEISSILNITDMGIKKARYRLRKKLGIASDQNLQEFLLRFG